MPSSPIRQRVINGYQHIMTSNFVKGWVALVIVHFVVQVALQGLTLRDNKQAKGVTNLCLSLAQVPMGLPRLDRDGLSMCDGIPGHGGVTCILIASASSPPLQPNGMRPRALSDFNLDGVNSITISGNEHSITGRCALSLQWIHNIFRDNVAEDVATICFQFWLLVVSLLAVLQDSIPHLAVCIASHLLDVGWVGFRIKSTITLRKRYYSLVVDSACRGEDLLGSWWDQRLAHAAPLFATNVITLILLGVLSAVLFRRFARINFSRVGTSPEITKMYKIALAFFVFLQLAAFFTILAVGMWIDRVSTGAINTLAKHIQAYQATFIVLAVIITPWIVSGWWAIFREIKWAFVLFGVLHAFILTLWPTMFASPIYRYIFEAWSFFASVSVASYLFVIATTIMAVICRLHFGKGLEHFLRVEAALSSSGFPGSYFTNDPTHSSGGSPTSFDFGLFDSKKARNGSVDDEKGGSMSIRPYTMESNEYSVHTLSFETSTIGSKTPPVTPLSPPSDTGMAIIRSLKKGGVKFMPNGGVKYQSRADSYGPKRTILTRDREKSWIQPPPEAYLQAPYNETRSRKETPSLITQATATSTNSYSQAVITFARKSPFVSATPRTLRMNTMSSKDTPSPGKTVPPRKPRSSTDSGVGVSISMGPQRRPTLVTTIDNTQDLTQFVAPADWETAGGAGQDAPARVNFHPEVDNYGRI